VQLSTLSLHFILNMNFKSICVCGAGTMGSGIAQLSAAAGFDTVLYEVDIEVLERSRTIVEKNLERLIEKNAIAREQKEEIFSRIRFTPQLTECVGEVVIEAIVERAEAKIKLLNQLAKINQDKTILATNTSSLSVSEIGNKVSNPQRVIGMHFFNPAPLMKLVEVVKTEKTSDEVVYTIVALAGQMGKVPVVCMDSPGFIVNRVARPFYIESLRLIEEKEIDFKTIDRLLEATGFKMGPFKLMDLIGNDVNYAVSNSIFQQLNKPARLRPSSIQKEKVERGELGKKTGKGYYQYD